jgi:UDP-4-amino-4-deoxy-L-arabinose formyltransferase/UDP-glucuronic acid dehydrogenase (UDP-4-keto-hexauronic acid decarboxylating)
MKVLLIGDQAAGVRTLQSLAQSEARIVAVMASPPRQTGQGGRGLWNLAAKLGYTTWPAELVRQPNFASQVYDAGVDIILNVYSLLLIRKEILEAPRLGSFNLHPGPLPRYAGLNSVCWAIYKGESEHGITLHKIVPEIDAGPIVYQEVVGVESEETGLSLTAKCVDAGVPLVLRLLETAAQGPARIPLVAQDLTKREYFGREVPENGNLSWDRPARQISNFVRASDFFPFPSPWGAPRSRLGDLIFGISKVRLTGRPTDVPPGTVGAQCDGGVEVASADDWLVVRQVFREGKYIPAKEVLKAGDRFVDCATYSVFRSNAIDAGATACIPGAAQLGHIPAIKHETQCRSALQTRDR